MTQKCRRAALAPLLAASVILAAVVPLAAQSAQDAPLEGFTAEGSAAHRQLEERFRAVPAHAQAREHLRQLTKEPHVAGTAEDYQTALYVRDRLRAYGVPAELKEYQVLLPTPRAPTVLELLAPRRERLLLREPVVAEDPSSSSAKIIPPFNAYSASGDVSAPLVYVNYGLPEDYAALKRLNVDVKGKIAIARYGRSFRGVKAKVAEENGAIGLVIYSDPADDGYAQGDVYPNGPWRPEGSAQRGSVLYIFQHPGDPLTPGTPSITGTPRLTREQATNLPRIPVQPISYGDARKLLAPLRGPVRPEGFQGALPFAYHVGGTTDVRVRLKTDMEFRQTTIWNVIGRVEGAQEPDRWVILGNHRDAWTFGAVDPNSGSTAMLEVARGLGELLKTGWRPRRTIVFGSWDAEEHGLIGSTEWAEELAAELREKAVAYVNMDAAVSGPNFGASSVPSLWKLIRVAARDVRDPKTGKSVYQAWQDRSRESRPDAELTDESGTDTAIAEARIGALGSGSDYTPFLQHLGVPSIDMGFGGDYGVYHSAYDSFHWMSKFGDPKFEYHTAAAQIWGTVALRLAEAPALPFDYADYAEQIRDFVNETQRTASRRRMADSFDAKSLLDAARDLGEEAARVRAHQHDLNGEIARSRTRADDSHPRAVARLRRLNDALIAAERALTDPRGLRGRPWYRHQIYAPGFYTGYAAQPLPDLRQAIDDRNTTSARDAAQRIAEAIRRAIQTLRAGRED
ncbi:MAG TPA: M28 family metallopeptidase [Pyrinomonadaceae bacterium]|nr:M28 family metallopeptidase [Pyrinomonadaceae bacterium]